MKGAVFFMKILHLFSIGCTIVSTLKTGCLYLENFISEFITIRVKATEMFLNTIVCLICHLVDC